MGPFAILPQYPPDTHVAVHHSSVIYVSESVGLDGRTRYCTVVVRAGDSVNYLEVLCPLETVLQLVNDARKREVMEF